MRISVVIPNWNGAGFVGRTLDALGAQTRRPDEVVVVDNASTDASLDVVRSHPIGARVVALPRNTGFAGGANAGVCACAPDAELVAVLNSDARPAPDWLELLEEEAAVSPADVWAWGGVLVSAATGLVESAGDAWRPTGQAFKLAKGRPVEELPARPYEVLAPPGAAPLIRRQAFEALGGYEERFFLYYEDIDLALRAWLRGWHAVVVPAAHVEHDMGRSSIGSNRPRRFVARNSLLTYLRCSPSVHPRVVWRTTRKELRFARRDGYGAAYIAGRLTGLAGAPRALAGRRVIQATARRSTLPPVDLPTRPLTTTRTPT